MIKDARPDHPIHELIRRRWSPRAFSDRALEHEKILSLLEAARWAPSSANEQPWRFIVTTREQESLFSQLASVLNEGNRSWAQMAPVLMLVVAKTYPKDDTSRKSRTALYDTGLAVGNLVLQATALDLYVHQMAGFDVQKAREAFQIPELFEPIALISIGYLGHPAMLPEDQRVRESTPRERKPLSYFVFSERWGEGSEIVE